jgi:hypothetical protein
VEAHLKEHLSAKPQSNGTAVLTSRQRTRYPAWWNSLRKRKSGKGFASSTKAKRRSGSWRLFKPVFFDLDS